jgi:transcriptional regulator with XRE-family HTH domain
MKEHGGNEGAMTRSKWNQHRSGLTVADVTRTDVQVGEAEYRRLLGQALVELRRSAGRMSQADLAAALHRSEAAVSRWETGKAVPSAFDLRRIADAFGLEPADADLLLFPPEAPTSPVAARLAARVDQERPIRRLPSRGLGGARNVRPLLDEGSDAT